MASSFGQTIGEPTNESTSEPVRELLGEPISQPVGNTADTTSQLSAVFSDTPGQDFAATFTSLADPAATLGTLTQTAVLSSNVNGGQNLWPFLLYAIAVALLLGITLVAAWLLGARTRHTAATDMPFESGIVPVGSAQQTRLSIEFYLIAIFFVIFDLETIFIFAWGVAFFELGWAGYLGASAFIVILLIVLVYEWRTGALDWGVLARRERSSFATRQETD